MTIVTRCTETTPQQIVLDVSKPALYCTDCAPHRQFRTVFIARGSFSIVSVPYGLCIGMKYLILLWRVSVMFYFGNSLQICTKIERSISGVACASPTRPGPSRAPAHSCLAPEILYLPPPTGLAMKSSIPRRQTLNLKKKCRPTIVPHLSYIFQHLPNSRSFGVIYIYALNGQCS